MREHAAELAAPEQPEPCAWGDHRAVEPRRQLHCLHRRLLRAAEFRKLVHPGGIVAGRHRDREQGGIDGTGFADGERGDRHASGICTIDNSESRPCRWRLGTGTPSTGTVVFAASMPGR